MRVYADFAEYATLAEVLAVIGRCRTDLDPPIAAHSRSSVAADSIADAADCLAGEEQQGDGYGGEHGGGDAAIVSHADRAPVGGRRSVRREIVAAFAG